MDRTGSVVGGDGVVAAGSGTGSGAVVDLIASSSIGESGSGGGISVPSVRLKSKVDRAGSSNRPLGLPLKGIFVVDRILNDLC